MNPFLFVLHPLVLVIASTTIFHQTGALTTSYSPARYPAFLALVIIAYLLPWSLRYFIGTTGWPGRVMAGGGFVCCASFFDKMFIRRWEYEHYYPEALTTQTKPAESPKDANRSMNSPQGVECLAAQYRGTRTEFATEVTGARAIGTFWQAKNVPNFSPEDPDFIPSRTAFMLVQAIAVLGCFWTHNLAVDWILSIDKAYLTLERATLFPDASLLTLADLKARVIVTLAFWISQYCMLQFFYSLAAFLSNPKTPQDIKMWPPLFGLPRNADSIRDFWGKAWHQNLRPGFESNASFIAHDVLQLPRKGLLQRYTKISIAFALSGAQHVVSDAGGLLPFAESGAMTFFLIQALGIMTEDGVQWFWRRYFRVPCGRRLGGEERLSKYETIIGHAWFLIFFVWTSPPWLYPIMRITRKRDTLLGFTALKPLFFGPWTDV
jgi:hypothetical protein